MDQDGIELWLITLRNSVPNHDPNVPDLFQLLPEAVRLLNENLDLLGHICQIMESYMLLDCPRILQVSILIYLKGIGEVTSRKASGFAATSSLFTSI